MQHDKQYMKDFMQVFSGLERWGPGSVQESLTALSKVPNSPQHILEIGCGKGLTTHALAKNTQARITAIDNEPDAIAQLNNSLLSSSLSHRVNAVCANMEKLPFAEQSFDLIWAEGCAYIIGVSSALSQWRPYLKESGVLMVSDLVWLTQSPSTTSQQFFAGEYPDMQTVATRLEQMQKAQYTIIDHFSLSQKAWENYYLPLKRRALELQTAIPESKAIIDIIAEVEIYEKYLGEFGYQMFLLQKV